MKSFFRALFTIIVIVFAVIMVVPTKMGAAGDTVEVKEQSSIIKTISEAILPEPAPEPEDLPEGAEYCWVKQDGFRLSEVGEKSGWSSSDTLKVYYPLNTAEHSAFVFPNENGFFNLDNKLRVSELIAALDVICDDRAQAETIVKAEAGEGESITKAQLFAVLSHFFPAPLEKAIFSDLTQESKYYPDFCIAAENGWIESGDDVAAEAEKELSRADFIVIMNNALERTPGANVSEEQVGGSLDVLPSDGIYPQFAEAAVSHEHTNDRWSDSTPLEKHDEGFLLLSNRLYYVDENGHFVKNGEVQGRTLLNGDVTVFHFGSDGVYTSGDSELDELMFQCYDELLTPDMEKLEMLRVIYDHIVDDFSYLRKHWVHEFGEHGWTVEEAKDFLATGRGNCYGFAASFCELARGLGYDAAAFSGYIGKLFSPHGWVEIEIDGVIYVFDTETQWSSRHNTDHEANMFMLDPMQAREWTYTKSKEDAGYGDK